MRGNVALSAYAHQAVCVSLCCIMQAIATGVETGIVGAFSEGGTAARTAARVLWMMAHREPMLLMTGEPNVSSCPRTETAPLVVVEASKIGKTKAGMRGKMQVYH